MYNLFMNTSISDEKTYKGPRRVWVLDYHGCAPSKEVYKDILVTVDMTTTEIRLFVTKTRTGVITADAVLQDIVLRDNVPDVKAILTTFLSSFTVGG